MEELPVDHEVGRLALIVAFTGHRPDKLVGKIPAVSSAIQSFLMEGNTHEVISGMAEGVDQIAAAWARILRIPWRAAVPFPGQESRWNQRAQESYHKLILDAWDIVVCDEEYHPWSFQKRNEWMVDNCELLVAVWDGSPGGTRNCLEYARRTGREVRYLRWLDGDQPRL